MPSYVLYLFLDADIEHRYHPFMWEKICEDDKIYLLLNWYESWMSKLQAQE